jgi:hypothetical protein
MRSPAITFSIAWVKGPEAGLEGKGAGGGAPPAVTATGGGAVAVPKTSWENVETTAAGASAVYTN